MLSLQFIREFPETVRQAAADKNVALDLDRLLALDTEVRRLKTRIDELRRQRNEISAGFKTADPAERPALGQKAKALGAETAEAENELAVREAELGTLMLRLPGIPWDGLRSVRTRASISSSVRKAPFRSSTSSRAIMSRSSR
jgi:seryl-tRNA synthetase